MIDKASYVFWICEDGKKVTKVTLAKEGQFTNKELEMLNKCTITIANKEEFK